MRRVCRAYKIRKICEVCKICSLRRIYKICRIFRIFRIWFASVKWRRLRGLRRGCLIMRIVDLVKVVNTWVRQCFNLLRQEEMCKDSLDSLVKIFFSKFKSCTSSLAGPYCIYWVGVWTAKVHPQAKFVGRRRTYTKNTHPKAVTLTILCYVYITFLDRIYIFIYMECVWHVLECSLEPHCLLVGT